jgi:hypothetical protein
MQNKTLSKLKAFYTNGKLSKCRFQKWAWILHLKLQVSCYKLVVMIKRKIISQIASSDSQPLKLQKTRILFFMRKLRHEELGKSYHTVHFSLGKLLPKNLLWGLPLNQFCLGKLYWREKLIWRNWQGCYFSSSILSMKKRKKLKKLDQTLNFWVERVMILTIASFYCLWKYCAR